MVAQGKVFVEQGTGSSEIDANHCGDSSGCRYTYSSGNILFFSFSHSVYSIKERTSDALFLNTNDGTQEFSSKAFF